MGGSSFFQPGSHSLLGRAHDDPVWRVSMSPTAWAPEAWLRWPLCEGPKASLSTPHSFHHPLPLILIACFLPWAQLGNSSQHSLRMPHETAVSSRSESG